MRWRSETLKCSTRFSCHNMNLRKQRFWNRVEHERSGEGDKFITWATGKPRCPTVWPYHSLEKCVPSFACCSPNKLVFRQLSAGVPLCSCFCLPPCTWDALQDLELWELLLSVWSTTVIFSLFRQTSQCTTLNIFWEGGVWEGLFMTCFFNTLILGWTLCHRRFHLYLMFDATQFTVNWQMSLQQHPKITC